MFYVVNKYLLRRGFAGVTLYPFVIMRDATLREDAVFMNHEKIHLRQQRELLILPFFLWYGVEFLVRCVQYRNRYVAYRNISFEREAYAQETNFIYLKDRNFWSFLKFL
ncbi:hypothetical protein EAX61_04980 [Dokdonia sinensis]|uniref:Peptidase M56 domain-containing protein n=1 Tax=Dokdonia sinensis TaxID=2479847 RepID=A0A3M0GDX9_9FLAO|nr:hypothetical protein [Dokdonia sinensis]RMB62930.1 hypothetical protein EAX61_04980 [Dokdonia sinensis]